MWPGSERTLLPYSREIQHALVEQANAEWTAFPVLGMLSGLLLLAALCSRSETTVRLVGVAFGLLWLACGGIWFFSLMQPLFFAAPWLGALACAQGVLLLLHAARPFPAAPHPSIPAAISISLALLWPLLDLWSGVPVSAARIPGLGYEPLVLLTCGLWFAAPRHGAILWLLPALGLSGFAAYAAWAHGAAADFLVPAAAIGALAVSPAPPVRNRLW